MLQPESDGTRSELAPASRCPSPRRVKPSDLPPDAESNEIESLGLELSTPAGLELESLNELSNNPEYADLSQAQLYDLNQQLMDDSVVHRPLVSGLQPLSELREEYKLGSPEFLGQIDWLIANGYESFRRAKGDGDCFYRALGFAYVESLLHSDDQDTNVAQSLSLIESTKKLLLNQGIEPLVFEDPLEDFNALIQSIATPRAGEKSVLTDQSLLEVFQDTLVSNTIVMFLRLLTSAQIRQNRESYEHFVVHPDTREPMDIDSFCANIVQPMGREADNVEIDALCRVLRLNVDVVYLNGRRADSVDVITFRNDPNANAKPLILLYRPGHYDILRKRA